MSPSTRRFTLLPRYLVSLPPLAAAVGLLSPGLSAQTYTFITVAGSAAYSDGPSGAARFYIPFGVAADSSNNVYVADFLNHVIRKIVPLGTNWIVSTLAGRAGVMGTNDGSTGSARFNQPTGVAADSGGNVYVADSQNHTIRKITAEGTVSTLAGIAGLQGTNDGTGGAARFNLPFGLGVDNSNNVYVADTYNNTIRKINAAGAVITVAGMGGVSGTNNGTGSAARFNLPAGVAVDGSNNLYVADILNNTIRKITPSAVVSTFAGLAGTSGTNDGSGSSARFDQPTGVAVDRSNNVYVADFQNSTIRKITAAGLVSTLAGLPGVSGTNDGIGSAARFNHPYGVAADRSNNVYVADNVSSTIRKITTAAVVTTFAARPSGGRMSGGASDGPADTARFLYPHGLASDASNNVYVADEGNHTIRKITPAGVVSTLAGMAGISGTNDGTGSTARFYVPEGVAVDSSNNVYVADQYNHTIRKITAAGAVSTIAGLAGAVGSVDGTNGMARFSYPSAVAVDPSGNVYVTDPGNSTMRKIKPMGTNWVVTTIAGLAGVPGITDGTNNNARFDGPWGVTAGVSGELYVADAMQNTIRKMIPVGTNWVVSTLAGKAGTAGSADGTGTNALFNVPVPVAIDGSGNILVGDGNNSTIRRITPGGAVTTIAGVAGAYANVDGTGSTARFYSTYGLCVDMSGYLYVADYTNNIIRKGIPKASLPPIALQSPRLDTGRFAVGLTGPTGVRADIEATSGVSNSAVWQTIGSYVLEGGTNYAVDLRQLQSAEIYRARLP